MILTIRTDQPEAQIALFKDKAYIASEQWEAHRILGITIHVRINGLLQSTQSLLADVEGVVFYKGPGSFTGLRIGASVANTLAYVLNVSVQGETGQNWQLEGIRKLSNAQGFTVGVVPMYGAAPHITQSKK